MRIEPTRRAYYVFADVSCANKLLRGGIFEMKQHRFLTNCCAFLLIIISVNPVFGQVDFPKYLAGNSWDTTRWTLDHSAYATIDTQSFKGINDNGLKVIYDLYPGYPDSSGWVTIHKDYTGGWTENTPVVLFIKTSAESDIELKFIDDDGSVFLKRYSMKDNYLGWNLVVVYLRDTHYGWGGDSSFGTMSGFEISFTGKGSGTVLIDEIGFGKQGLPSGVFIDPYWETEYGFYQRRDFYVHQEDTLVLEYLKVLQDSSSSNHEVLPNQDHLPWVSTYNNALAAMVFVMKNQKERAEHILNFYASRIDSTNQDSLTQAFFVNRQARGFYQQMLISNYSRGDDSMPRWIGDNAWLLLAYKQYENKYGHKAEYDTVAGFICNLLKSFYKPVDDSSGYIQTGWQKGDTFFDTTGHKEGNIDCYAALKSCGEKEYTKKIGNWLKAQLQGNDLWLDNYTWRALAFGVQADSILSIAEYDTRFRKKVYVHGDSLYGFYPYPNGAATNVWTEGVGQMACAQWNFGDRYRGYFYANQFDPLVLHYTLFGKSIATLPYVANRSGEYSWIDTTIGAVSSSAWYVFAKNGFNPMSIDTVGIVGVFTSAQAVPQHYGLHQNFPNPFNPKTVIGYQLSVNSKVGLRVYDMLGRIVATLVDEEKPAGTYTVTFDASRLSSGVYFYRLQANSFVETKKFILLR